MENLCFVLILKNYKSDTLRKFEKKGECFYLKDLTVRDYIFDQKDFEKTFKSFVFDKL